MKCIKCHNTLHTETGDFSMTINGKTIKVINAPVLHCKTCKSVISSDEVKEKAKEFSEVYLYPDNTLDYAECEAGTVMSVMNLRGRKIFCVYGEKSSLIRTRYV